ncbi:MAG: hypothetical protein WBP11_04400 [Dokdonella sp.]
MSRRIALFVVISAVLIVGVVLVAAGVSWSAPFAPAERRQLEPADFQIVMGSALHTEAGLEVGAVGNERVALQALPLGAPGIDATAFDVLRYRFENFPRTLELSFLFRRASDPDDVQVVSLPWPGRGESTLNLRDVPTWKGQITEIGFIEAATPQLIPNGIPFASFRLVNAQLWSSSWRGGLAALSTDWVAYRPWGLFSVSSVDQEAGLSLPRRPALLLVVESTIFIVGVVGVLLLGWRRREFRIGILAVFALGWILLDAVWVGQLYERQATTRKVYAGKSWAERARLVPDDGLLKAADRLRAVVARTNPTPRVVIHAATPFEMTRLQYLALPVNAGLLVRTIDSMSYNFPPGTLLVLYGMQDWTYDADSHQVRTPDLTFPSDPVLVEGALRVFRIIEREQP